MFRKGGLLPLACLGFLILLFGLRTGRQEVAAQSPTGEVIRLVNELRTSYGLAGYTSNSQLATAAQSHANWMASTGLYSHTGAGGSTPVTRAAAAGFVGFVAENIVGGSNLTPQQGVTWWINSPVHFNTLISNRYTEVGVGFAQSGGQNFYVLVAGLRDDAASTAPAAVAAREEGELFIVAPIVLASPREDGSIVHTVGSGQSLWAIAARYEVPLQDILLFNNLTESSTIQPGDELIIRLAEGAEPPPTPTPPTTHVVISGDSAWTIAARYNISLDDFLWYNSMAEDDPLQPGDVVVIRLAEGQPLPPTPTPKLAHIVKSGETLWDISLLYGLTVEQLLEFNNFTESTVLSIGQEVLIRPPIIPTPPPATFTPVPSYTPVSNAALASVALTAETPVPSRTPVALAGASLANAAGQSARTAAAEPPAGADNMFTFGLVVLAGIVILIGCILYVAVQRLVPDRE